MKLGVGLVWTSLIRCNSHVGYPGTLHSAGGDVLVESVAVFHDDSLGLEVLVECLFPEVFAESGHFESAEGRGHVGLVVGVDEARSGVDTLGNAHGLVEVVGQHTGGKTVLSGVGAPNNLGERKWLFFM